MLSNCFQSAKFLEEAKESAKFASMFDKFFNCMNVSSLLASQHSRNAFNLRHPIALQMTSLKGWYVNIHIMYHIQWLEENFIRYLDNWKC